MAAPQQNYYQFLNAENLAAQQKLMAGYYQQMIQMYGLSIQYFRRKYDFFDPDGLLNADAQANFTYGYDSNYEFGNVIDMRGYIEMGNDAFIFSMVGIDSQQDGKVFFTKEQFSYDFLNAIGRMTTNNFATNFTLDVENFEATYLHTEDYEPFSLTFNDDVEIDYTPAPCVAYSDISEYNFVESFNIRSIAGITSSNISNTSFNDDGTIMYVSVFWTTELYQYTLSAPWDISNPTFTGKTFTDTKFGGNNDLVSFRFKPDGTVLYRLNAVERVIHQYSLTTPWDISTADISNKLTFDLDPTDEATYFYGYEGFTISDNGLKLYVTEDMFLKEFTLSTAWDISTLSFTNNVNLDTLMTVQPTEPYGIYTPNFNDDGTRMYLGLYDWDEGLIHQYSLTTPWDTTTMTYDMSYDTSNEVVTQYGLFTDPSGNNAYVVTEDNSFIYHYYKAPGSAVCPPNTDPININQDIDLTVSDASSNINNDIVGYKSYTYNWIIQGLLSGTVSGVLDAEGNGTLNVTASGDLTYNRPATDEESNGWKIAPQSGDFLRITYGDGETEDFSITSVTDRDLNQDGISPFLGKFVWKCEFTRRTASHETVPSGYESTEVFENDYTDEIAIIQDEISDEIYDYGNETEDDVDDGVYGGF